MTAESYKTLLQGIVDSHVPEEALVFEVEGERMVNSLFSEQWEEDNTQGHADRYGFADLTTVKPVLDIVVIALTTFKVITELRLLKKKGANLDLSKVQQHWEQRLRQDGVKSGKAKVISTEFTQDVMALADRE